MNIIAAAFVMQEGKSVRRPHWMDRVWKVGDPRNDRGKRRFLEVWNTSGHVHYVDDHFQVEDLLADDWEIAE